MKTEGLQFFCIHQLKIVMRSIIIERKAVAGWRELVKCFRLRRTENMDREARVIEALADWIVVQAESWRT